jgi:hypothetical protein
MTAGVRRLWPRRKVQVSFVFLLKMREVPRIRYRGSDSEHTAPERL